MWGFAKAAAISIDQAKFKYTRVDPHYLNSVMEHPLVVSSTHPDVTCIRNHLRAFSQNQYAFSDSTDMYVLTWINKLANVTSTVAIQQSVQSVCHVINNLRLTSKQVHHELSTSSRNHRQSWLLRVAHRHFTKPIPTTLSLFRPVHNPTSASATIHSNDIHKVAINNEMTWDTVERWASDFEPQAKAVWRKVTGRMIQAASTCSLLHTQRSTSPVQHHHPASQRKNQTHIFNDMGTLDHPEQYQNDSKRQFCKSCKKWKEKTDIPTLTCTQCKANKRKSYHQEREQAAEQRIQAPDRTLGSLGHTETALRMRMRQIHDSAMSTQPPDTAVIQLKRLTKALVLVIKSVTSPRKTTPAEAQETAQQRSQLPIPISSAKPEADNTRDCLSCKRSKPIAMFSADNKTCTQCLQNRRQYYTEVVAPAGHTFKQFWPDTITNAKEAGEAFKATYENVMLATQDLAPQARLQLLERLQTWAVRESSRSHPRPHKKPKRPPDQQSSNTTSTDPIQPATVKEKQIKDIFRRSARACLGRASSVTRQAAEAVIVQLIAQLQPSLWEAVKQGEQVMPSVPGLDKELATLGPASSAGLRAATTNAMSSIALILAKQNLKRFPPTSTTYTKLVQFIEGARITQINYALPTGAGDPSLMTLSSLATEQGASRHPLTLRTPQGKAKFEQCIQLGAARDKFWEVTDQARLSADHKAMSRDPEWRKARRDADWNIYNQIEAKGNRKLDSMTRLIRSKHPDRAQLSQNPTKVISATTKAVQQQHMTQQHSQYLVDVAKAGVRTGDFRDFNGPAYDMSASTTDDEADLTVLEDYYWEHAAMGRILVLDERATKELDSRGELVLSPSFVVNAAGKKPRPILNLSADNNGVKQRLEEELPANPQGYCTIPDISSMIIKLFVSMVLLPVRFQVASILGTALYMIVIDAQSAFFAEPVHHSAVGLQATRIRGLTFVLLCCSFGFTRSAENFSHVSAGIKAVYAADLDDTSLLTDEHLHSLKLPHSEHILRQVLNNNNPAHSHTTIVHVDDCSAIEFKHDQRPRGAAADLIWAIKIFLGEDGVSPKKFVETSFWSQFHKAIGAWFDCENFTVTMPACKIQQALDILASPEFDKSRSSFSIAAAASLRGKLRWASVTSPLGDVPCLIGIEKQRQPDAPDRKVRPWRYPGETEQLTLKKFHNDLFIRTAFLQAALVNPSIATCSMVSVLPVEERLHIPGQSAKLAWLSGDFSKKGQSFGIEYTDDNGDTCLRWSFLEHPEEVIQRLEAALAGGVAKATAVVSSVLERQNKMFAQVQWRTALAGRPIICLEDNTGSVACINSGYANNIHMQAMQLAANLIATVDESRMTAFYCNTHNMSWFDETSRTNQQFKDKMQQFLIEHNLPQWQYEPPSSDTIAVSEWLAHHWDSDLPMVEELVTALQATKPRATLYSPTLNPDEIENQPDLRWQDRIRAAAHPIPHFTGSFGPFAYSQDHLPLQTDLGSSTLTWSQLKEVNQALKGAPGLKAFDAYSGGCGASIAAIQAGIHVRAGAELLLPEKQRFQDLTGGPSLGNVTTLDTFTIPPVHIWISCSSCIDFSQLGRKKRLQGTNGGDEFPLQIFPAAEAKALALVWENVEQVAGQPMDQLKHNAATMGYTNWHHQRVVLSRHNDPENRVRMYGVIFHSKVRSDTPFQFPIEHPKTFMSTSCAGDIILPSTFVPAKYWDHRPWHRVKMTWNRKDTDHIFTMGYCSLKDKIGSPPKPSRVFHPLGLLPTMLASGNTGLVLTIQLRAMCPLYLALVAWAKDIFARSNRRPQIGCVKKRKLTPRETLTSKGFPLGDPPSPDDTTYRFAGNAITITYFTRLLQEVATHIEQANVDTTLPPCYLDINTGTPQRIRSRAYSSVVRSLEYKAREANARTTTALDAHTRHKHTNTSWFPDLGSHTAFPDIGGRVGFHPFFNKRREEIANVPVTEEEIDLMAARRIELKLARYKQSSIKNIEYEVQHWLSFCARFGVPRLLLVNTPEEQRAATAAAELFILYELSVFQISGKAVNHKLWSVDVFHQSKRLPAPFRNNSVIQQLVKDAIAKDRPALSKVPIPPEQLQALKEQLDLDSSHGFCYWCGVRLAIAFLMRISEWAVNENHTIVWEYLTFFDRQGREITLISPDQVSTINELEILFWSDKSHTVGNGQARSFFAIPDLSDDRCIVRDMARLWLKSDQIPEHPVFSWDNNTKGVGRAEVNRRLKQAAVAVGIPAKDTASHSCRITGLSNLLANNMDFEACRLQGRWATDSTVRRYFWPSNTLAKDYAAAIWNPVAYTRVRGDGAVQRIGGGRR